ncbi:MAG: substrate-binding domain-containing protein [Eubacterium sp.]|jgi:ABC-type sugar transport system substrate-binding protein|nr:substrate-binding domain-containing protein [Eubacterium sp.]
MKKILSLTTALALLLTLSVGCNTNQEPDTADISESATTLADTQPEQTSTETEEGQKTYRIGFANASVSNSWRVKMRDMLLEEVERRGNIELIETDAQDDAALMNSNIESMLQQDLDAILITPCVEDAVNPGIEMAYATGIPVILFDRHASTSDFTHFVGYSDRQNGVDTAKLMIQALTEKNGEPKGNIIALDTIAGSSTDTLIKEGWDEVFSQYPDVKIVARQYTDFEVSKGKTFMEDCLTRFGPGEIDGFISQDGGVTLGAFDAIEEAGRGDEGLVCTNADGINGVVKLIKEGKVYGITQFPCRCSVDALSVAVDVLEGRSPSTKDVYLPSVVVDINNVDEYLIPDGDDFDWTL